MSSKLGVILSSIFIVFAFLLGADLISYQVIFANLDSKSVNISYLISRSVTIDENFKTYVDRTYNVDFICSYYGTPAFGDSVEYVISQNFRPFMIANESVTVSVTRMTIVGYYG